MSVNTIDEKFMLKFNDGKSAPIWNRSPQTYSSLHGGQRLGIFDDCSPSQYAGIPET